MSLSHPFFFDMVTLTFGDLVFNEVGLSPDSRAMRESKSGGHGA